MAYLGQRLALHGGMGHSPSPRFEHRIAHETSRTSDPTLPIVGLYCMLESFWIWLPIKRHDTHRHRTAGCFWARAFCKASFFIFPQGHGNMREVVGYGCSELMRHFFFFDLLYPFFLDDAEGMRWGSPFFVMLAAGWESRRI